MRHLIPFNFIGLSCWVVESSGCTSAKKEPKTILAAFCLFVLLVGWDFPWFFTAWIWFIPRFSNSQVALWNGNQKKQKQMKTHQLIQRAKKPFETKLLDLNKAICADNDQCYNWILVFIPPLLQEHQTGLGLLKLYSRSNDTDLFSPHS